MQAPLLVAIKAAAALHIDPISSELVAMSILAEIVGIRRER